MKQRTITETLVIIKLTLGGFRTWILQNLTKLLIIMLSIIIMMLYPNLKEFSNDSTNIAKSLASIMMNPSSDFRNLQFDYVPRQHIEKQILSFTSDNRIIDGSYCIVYGPKGAGKSAVVNHLMRSKTGVLKIDVADVASKDSILLTIAIQCNIHSSDLPLTEKNFLVALNDVKRKLGETLIIVFEIERSKGQNDTTIAVVRSLAKAAAGSVHVFIVLSEANAVLEFGRDLLRERFIFVDEMTASEASAILQDKFTPDEKQFIFETVGTSPLRLRRLISDVLMICKLNEHIEHMLAAAEVDFAEFPLIPILKALKEHPNGLDKAYFKGQVYNGVNLDSLAAVGVFMKESNVLVYRLELHMYQLMSTAHKTALRAYEFVLQEV